MIASTLASPRRKAINSLRLLYKLHNGNTISSIEMLLMIQDTSISNALGSMSSSRRWPPPLLVLLLARAHAAALLLVVVVGVGAV